MSATEQPIESMTVLSASIHDAQVLIPSAAIAEIIEFQNTHTDTDDLPTWYLGKLSWRKTDIPVISLESINHDTFFTQKNNLKIVVIHGLTQRDKLLYWAFVTLETPRMIKIDNQRLQPLDASDENINHVCLAATLDNETVLMPNLDAIEQQILTVLA